MRAEQFAHFVDPSTKTPLKLVDAELEGDQVRSGKLVSDDGSISYPVVDSIPRFVPKENYAQNFGLQWNKHRKTQLDSYNGSTYSHDRLFGVTGWDQDLKGQKILEIGSGAGRFTEIIAKTGCDLYTLDYSIAVDANFMSNGHNPNVTFMQASLYDIPFPEGFFDRVCCFQMIHNTPDVRKSFASIAKMVRPGGQLVVDAYVKRLQATIHWKTVLRPFMSRLPPETLYKFTAWYAPKLMPVAGVARKVAGRAGHRLVPILDQQDKDVSKEVQRDWTILDTYDALGSVYDYPQTEASFKSMYEENGFKDLDINLVPILGLYGRGTKPE